MLINLRKYVIYLLRGLVIFIAIYFIFNGLNANAACVCEHSFCLSPPDPDSCDPSGVDPNPVKSIDRPCGPPGSCQPTDECTRPLCYGCGDWTGECQDCPGDYCPNPSIDIECIASCGGGPPPPPPGCVDDAPAAPTLASPANGSTIVSYSVFLDWDHSDFGENCSGGSNEYEIWIDGAFITTIPGGTTSYTHNFPTTAYGSHTWSVVATNGNEDATGGPWSFNIQRHSRIIGWLWEDFQGDGSVEASDLWSHSTISCPADHNTDNFTMTQGGGNVIAGWACNTPQGGSNNPYLFTNYFQLNNGTGQGTYTLVFGGLPSGGFYDCADVSWTYQRCTAVSGGNCTNTTTQTGTGCTASNLVLGDVNGINFSNWFWWKIDQRNRVVGRVWEDFDGDNTLDIPADLWAPPSISCPPAHTSSNISLSGSATIASWECNPNAYYTTSFMSMNNNGEKNITLTLNNRVDNVLYPCSLASWSFMRCTNLGCTTTQNSSGSGCTANVTIGEDNGPTFTNHIQWRIAPDPPDAPTASLYPPAPISDGQGIHIDTTYGYDINVFPTTLSSPFASDASDVDNNLSTNGVYRRPYDPTGAGTELDPPSTIASGSCSGGSCYTSGSTTIATGYSTYYPTVSDTTGLSCTGRHNIPVGYSDCDLGPAPDSDISYTYGDIKPTCSTSNWPAVYTGPDQVVTLPTNSYDGNGHTVQYDLDASCGSFKDVDKITVSAYGECSGGCPSMWITAVYANGTRSNYSGINVTTGQQNYTWDPVGVLNDVTMVEVRYTNDNNLAGRNLRVYSVSVYEPGISSPFITFEPEQNTNQNLKVFYDTLTPYDGGDVFSYDNDPNTYFITANGYVHMRINGTLRFPMMWVSPSSGSCNLTFTPRVSLPYYDGPSCSLTLDPLTRTVTGSIYETNGGACGWPGSGYITDNNTGIQLKSGGVNVGPVGTFTDGFYTIDPVWANTAFDSICITNPSGMGGGNAAYFINCLESSQITCSGNDGLGCALNCTPTNFLQGGNIVAHLGFNSIDNEKWFTFIDGDFFGDSVIADVSETPTGFTPNMINTQASTIGGYGFADDLIDPKRAGSGVSEAGGRAVQLGDVSAGGGAYYDFTDEWIENFSFAPPTHGDVETAPENTTPTEVRFTAGHIYSFDLDGFNDFYETRDTYRVTGASGSGVAIVYVTDTSGTLTFDHKFVTANNNSYTNRLILVTNLPVSVDPNFGIPDTEFPNYTVTGTSSTLTGALDLVIISSQDISLQTRYDWNTGTFDLPLLVDGALISKTAVNLDRDLGYVNNELHPGTTVRYYPRSLYRILEIEQNNSDISSYTGLTTFDLQWEYDQ